MTTASRYWRVSFRSTDTSSSGTRYTLALASLRFFNAAGTELSSSLTSGQISLTTGTSYDGTTYPLTNLVDSNAATVWVADYPTGVANRIQTLYTITFDFGSAVLPDYVLVRALGTTYSTATALAGTALDFLIDSSTDNITYYRQSMIYRPILAADADYRIPTTAVSSQYPFPSATSVGGSGGIYGIVSEDGVALPNRPVILFERDTFARVGFATTDDIGGYAFNGLNEAREFTVMSVDPSGPPYKNALVWDRIKPINTKSAIAPQSAFWARRARESTLGGIAAARDYIDSTNNFIAGNILGNTERRPSLPDGYAFSATTAVGGSLKFLKSNRTVSYTGEGLQIQPGAGLPTGVNAAGTSVNYANLTFEYIVQAPTASESSLYVVWSGTRDSDDVNMFNYDPWWPGTGWGAGPTLEITPAGVLNVRFPLGGRNRSTVRATTNVTPGSVYHVMVTYAQDSEIKLYVNGSLIQTTSITAAGRLWGHVLTGSTSSGQSGLPNFENWDYLFSTSQPNSAIRRFVAVTVAGSGNTINNAGTMRVGGPGYGGGWALAALYYRTFSAGDVSSFYDSYVNWETHYVAPTLSGYMGQVEADNPMFYARMNDASAPTRIASLVGQRDYSSGAYEGVPAFGATGFVSGATSTTVSNGGLRVDRIDVNSIFTIEMFCRPTSVTGTQRLLLARINNGVAPVALSMVSGVLRLNIVDVTTVDTLFQFTQTLVANTAYHVAVTYDPWYDKQCKLYINGSLVQTLSAAVIPVSNADWLFVGTNGSGSTPTYSERFQGQIGEFALYNYVLSASRIQAHYDARTA